jgi:hypothetical protein
MLQISFRISLIWIDSFVQVRKNEYYERTVRRPDEQNVQAYVPGQPFFVD